jgi:hypothetical protein
MADKTWELVYRQDNDITDRLRIPGGWLYRTCISPYYDSQSASVAMVFVPIREENYRG